MGNRRKTYYLSWRNKKANHGRKPIRSIPKPRFRSSNK